MRHLAECYYRGEGVEQDRGGGRGGHTEEENRAQAVVWYQKAADLGDAAANYEIARRYLTGEGVEKDAAHGVKLLRTVKYGVAMDARAEAALAQCYHTGEGVEVDTFQVGTEG